MVTIWRRASVTIDCITKRINIYELIQIGFESVSYWLLVLVTGIPFPFSATTSCSHLYWLSYSYLLMIVIAGNTHGAVMNLWIQFQCGDPSCGKHRGLHFNLSGKLILLSLFLFSATKRVTNQGTLIELPTYHTYGDSASSGGCRWSSSSSSLYQWAKGISLLEYKLQDVSEALKLNSM